MNFRTIGLQVYARQETYNKESIVMGSGSTRPNNADDKMIAAIERGDREEFKDRKPVKDTDQKLIKEKEERANKAKAKSAGLKALRLAAEKERAAK